MYESPIELIEKQMQLDMESRIVSAVQEVGISVDKEELVRALKYDRDQYTKGYNDAKAEQAEAIPVDWIEAEIKALRDLDFGFTTMTAGQIEAMLNKWRKEQNGQTDKCRSSESET